MPSAHTPMPGHDVSYPQTKLVADIYVYSPSRTIKYSKIEKYILLENGVTWVDPESGSKNTVVNTPIHIVENEVEY